MTDRASNPLRRYFPAAGAGLIAALLLALAAAPAQARLIDLYAGPRAGGIVGWGSRSSTPDFFQTTRGAAMGAEVGVKLLVLDLSVSFLQVFDGSGRSGTLSQALLGFELDVPIGQWRTREGRRKLILRPGAGAGVAFGTLGPVHPPLSNDQVSDKGFISQARLALEYNPYALLGFGVEGDFGYHYFVGGQTVSTSLGGPAGGPAGGPVVNNSSSYSVGPQMALLATLTFHLGY
jgi:hypothetical protein